MNLLTTAKNLLFGGDGKGAVGSIIEAVLAFMGVTWPPKKTPAEKPPQPRQGVGAACGGQCVDECARTFGTGLALACSSCGTAYERGAVQ
jgi:hypothetical protein